MTVTMDENALSFQHSVDQLYQEMIGWCDSLKIEHDIQKIQIIDGDIGEYEIDSLKLKDQNQTIAEFKPVGCRIIGAEGRMDLYGMFDREILVYLKYPGTSFSNDINGGQFRSSLYSNVKQTGWYWIESHIQRKALLITKETFLDLLNMVSDYESAQNI